MAKINILDSSIYNLIAAGEVVERPASVVKELVENSIDAGASIITIEIIEGGIRSIVVNDNGSGIERDDLQTAFLPHATSKISCKTDLDAITTLGFRGEALASIAAVSKTTIISKTKNSEIGGKIIFEGGKFISIEQVGAPVGTTAKVENLFFNVPARAKFLKKPKQEEQEITNLISRFILANPKIAFRYFAEGKLIFQSTGSGVEDALFCIYGKDSLLQTITLSAKHGDIAFFGYFGKPSFTKPNKTYQTIVINGRHIHNLQLSATIANAYGEMLMKRQFPFFVIYIIMPPDAVDVNVHPNKLEVRFENSHEILALVYETLIKGLNTNPEIREIKSPEFSQELKNATENSAKFPITPHSSKNNTNKIDYAGVNLATKENGFEDLKNIVEKDIKEENKKEEPNNKLKIINTIGTYKDPINIGTADGFGIGSSLLENIIGSPEKQDAIEPYQVKTPTFSDILSQNSKQQAIEIKTEVTIIGKLFNTYLIIQDNVNMYLIDQHAAHERILYEKFKTEIESGEIAIQPMLAPYILAINAQEKTIIEDNIDNLRKLGFEIEEFGQNTYKISSVPVIVSEINFDNFFAIFLQENKKNTEIKSIDLIKDKIMQLACKSAVKAGYDLSRNEIEKLYQEITNDKIALYCPHGRPIIIRITKQEIEKWFKRIV